MSFLGKSEPFFVLNESITSRRTLFLVHNFSDTGFRWDSANREWVKLSESGGDYVLKNLHKGEIEYDLIEAGQAEELFPGSTSSHPNFDGLTWGPGTK